MAPLSGIHFRLDGGVPLRGAGASATATTTGQAAEGDDGFGDPRWLKDRKDAYGNPPAFAINGSYESFFGYQGAWLTENVCIFVTQTLGCTRSLDWREEKGLVVLVRSLAPAFKVATIITHVVILVVAALSERSMYESARLYRCESDVVGNIVVGFTYFLWVVCILLSTASSLLVVVYSSSDEERSKRFFLFKPTKPIHSKTKNESSMHSVNEALLSLLAFFFFLFVFVVSCVSMFVVIGNVYMERLTNFRVLLALFASYLLINVLEEASLIGGIYGVQVDSRLASKLLSVRFFFGIATFVFSIIVSTALSDPYGQEYVEPVHPVC